MNTIPAAILIKWTETLANVDTALQDVENLRPMVPYPVWNKVWASRCRLISMRTELMRACVTNVTVEGETV